MTMSKCAGVGFGEYVGTQIVALQVYVAPCG